MVDRSAIRFHQGVLIMVLLVSYILGSPTFLVFLALVILFGAWIPKTSLTQFLYTRIAVPLKLMQPAFSEEDPAPHRFAQRVGALCVAGGAVLLLMDVTAGWLFIWGVIILATINLLFGFCMGCFLYFQFSKIRSRRIS